MRLFKLMVRNVAIGVFVLGSTVAAEYYIGYPMGGLVFCTFSIACLLAFAERKVRE